MQIVITGMGVVSPIGIGRQDFNQSLRVSRCGIVPQPPLDQRPWPFAVAGSVEDFNPKKFVRNRKQLKYMCREIQFGCAAAQLAVEDASLDQNQLDPDRVGVICGSENFFCHPATITDVYRRLANDTPIDTSRWIEAAMRHVEPLWMLKHLPNMVAGQIAIALDARGPSNSIVLGDLSGLLAIFEASEVIRRGRADLMIAGGAGARMNVVAMVYRGTDQLAKAYGGQLPSCQPFGKNRSGMILGEGAGMLVLENREHAEKRQAKILGTLKGNEIRCATSELAPEDAVFLAAQSALQKSTTSVDQLSHIDAHGDSTIQSDWVEAQGISKLGGQPPITALKSYFGNLGAGSPVVELIGSISGLREQTTWKTLGTTKVSHDCPIQLVLDEHRQQSASTFMKISRAATGQAAALVIDVE